MTRLIAFVEAKEASAAKSEVCKSKFLHFLHEAVPPLPFEHKI